MLNPTPNKGIGLLRLSKNITATITTSVGIKSSSKLQSKYIPILLSIYAKTHTTRAFTVACSEEKLKVAKFLLVRTSVNKRNLICLPMSDTPIDIAHLRCKVTIKFRYTQTNTTSPRLNKSNEEIILSFFPTSTQHL